MTAPSLLPQQSTVLERALEAVGACRMSALPVPLRTLYNPDLCPADLLGWLAWSQSVDVWDDEWPETQKRDVIRSAFMVHRHKGTVGAVRRALTALKIGLDIREWFETGDAPGTFRIDAFADRIFGAGYSINPQLLAMIAAHIDTIKPARAHYTLRVGERFTSSIAVRSASRVRQKHSQQIAMRPAAEAVAAAISVRDGFRLRRIHFANHQFGTSMS